MTAAREKRYGVLFAAALAAVSIAVYWKTLANGFVYDDKFQILRNSWITDFGHLGSIFTTDSYGFLGEGAATGTYRPMFFAVYTVEYAIFGLKPWGWHLVNVMIHAANTVAVFFTLALLLEGGRAGGSQPLRERFPAFAGALIFAVHPANSEAVAWVGCVPELMYTLLCLVSFCLYVVTTRDESRGIYTVAGRSLSVFFFFVAAFFKETAAVLPPLLFLYDCLMRRDERIVSYAKVKRYLPYFLAGLLYLAMRFYAVGGVSPGYKTHAYLTGFQKLLNAFPLFLKYLRTLVLPLSYHPVQPLDPVYSVTEAGAAVPLILTVFLFAAVFMFRKKLHPLVFLSLAVIVLPLLPGLYAFSVSITPFSDRYLYLPTVGYALAVSLGLQTLRGSPERSGVYAAATAVVLGAALAYAVVSTGRGAVWEDDFSLWGASYAGPGGNYIAAYSLGDAYLKEGMTDEAALKLNEALSLNSRREHPDKVFLYLTRKGLAEVYSRKGLSAPLAAEYAEILRLKPTDTFVSYNLAVMYQNDGRLKEAVELYKNALVRASKPGQRRDILNNLGSCYAALGDVDSAVASYTEALRYSPGDAVILRNLEAVTGKGR